MPLQIILGQNVVALSLLLFNFQPPVLIPLSSSLFLLRPLFLQLFPLLLLCHLLLDRPQSLFLDLLLPDLSRMLPDLITPLILLIT